MPLTPSLLVVDDDAADRELFALTLIGGFPEAEIQRAEHPALATQMLAARPFDCVLMDYNMPGMDGLCLARELKSAHKYLATVLVTSVGDEMLATEALRSGVSDYIPKSRITVESLQRIVSRAVQSCSLSRLIDEQREELENFAYALAHDFKQPIRQIITFAQLLSEDMGSDKVGEIRRHLDYLGNAATRLGKLVDVMSQYTLLSRPPALARVDLVSVLENVRTELASFIAERNGQLIIPSRAPTVRGNETLLSSVLQNLVINGLRYNASPTPRVECTAHLRSGACVLDIRDNGIGIEAAYIDEIFKPLKRLHNSSEYPGTGLGLTLARKAVLAQNGTIWCESTPGEGSLFHIQLPSARSARPAP